MGEKLTDLQERLFAQGKAGDPRRVLIVLQGFDTSGKGGTIKHVVGLVNPQGVEITSFGAPTAEERKHDFLWRVRRGVPPAGFIGVFDRSHYEDVLVVRVRELAPRSTWESRYEAINRFERKLVDEGVHLIKCFLHISFETWRERQLARLDNPAKHWKYNPHDVDDAGLWEQFQDAYNAALTRCNTEHARWHVIPSDRKWHRNLAVAQLLLETLEGMDLEWPQGDFDPEREKQRVRTVQPFV